MTREEIRRLVGGYATGSLTEAERKLLFEAALEDQELFDELSREQSLKELLDVPGAKARLIAALESGDPPPLKSRWAWVLAFAMGTAAIFGVYQIQHSKQPATQEVATAQKPANPEVEPASPAAPPPIPTPRAVEAPAPSASNRARQQTQEPFAAPIPVEPAPVVENAPAPAIPLPGPPPPAPPPPKPAAAADDSAKQEAQAVLKTDVAPESPQAATPAAQAPSAAAGGGRGPGGGGGGRGGRGGAGKAGGGFVGGGAVAALRANAALARFAVDYSITPEGLRIVPQSPGFLSVGANTNPTIFSTRLVPAGTPIVIAIPSDASALSIAFSASGALPTIPSVKHDETSGTLLDQNPPNQQILVTIPAKP